VSWRVGRAWLITQGIEEVENGMESQSYSG